MGEEENKKLGELLVQLADGNMWALQEIANLVEKILKAIGCSYYKNFADVEDAVHNLYLSLPKKACYFKKDTNACAWLVRIYENAIKSHLRMLRRENEYLCDEIAKVKTDTYVGSVEFIDNRIFAQELFNGLTREEQRIIIYYFWCKCTIREVASILCRPKSTIHNRLKNLEEKVKKIQK